MPDNRSEKVSMLSFAHLGYQKDLKSTPTHHAAFGLQRSGLLDHLYVLALADAGRLDPSRVNVPVPGGKTIPRMFYLADRLLPVDVDSRGVSIELLDRFVSHHLDDVGVLFSLPHFEHSIRKQHGNDGIVSVYGSTAHPRTNAELLGTELERWGYDADGRSLVKQEYAHNHGDYVLTLSPFAAESYVENGYADSEVFDVGPLGIDAAEYSTAEGPDDEFIVLYIANTTVLKGLGDLLDAWDRLGLDDARLVICGTMDDTVERTHRDQLNSLDSVERVGYVDNPREYYQKASMLVHPSITESFGKVILEAMASELPVVITENGPREFVDDAGFVVPIRNPDALADRIQYLYDHPEEAEQMGKRGREIAENATWEAFGDRVADAHADILDREGYR